MASFLLAEGLLCANTMNPAHHVCSYSSHRVYFSMCTMHDDVHTFTFSACRSLMCSRPFLLPPSCSGVTSPDCLIPSRGIGDIKGPILCQPLPKAQQQGRGSAGMKSSGTARISQCEEATGQEGRLLGTNTFFLIVGDPVIQQVKTDETF